MFVCMYACVWAYVCGFCRALWDVLEYRMCVCNYVSMCVRVCVCERVSVCECVCVCTCVYMYVCM